MRRLMALAAASAAIASCSCYSAAQPTSVRIVTIHRHDPSAFTEGLFFHGDALVESTGLNDKSFIRQYRLPTPQSSLLADGAFDDNDSSSNSGSDSTRAHLQTLIQKEFRFDANMFGEGVASVGDKLYALTYKAKVVLELALSNFTLLASHPIATSTGEGWGMTTDGTLLIVSDGSATIQFFDPHAAFALMRAITVHDAVTGSPVTNVNELEWVPGADEILANVWFENHILRINATDGAVLEVVDLSWLPNMVSNLATPAMEGSPLRRDAVMNGIALHPVTRHVFVTGKLWDSIFELALSSISPSSPKSRSSRSSTPRSQQVH